MLRVTQKPFRISEFTDSLVFTYNLSNRGDTAPEFDNMNCITFKMADPRSTGYKLIIHGQYNYGNLFGHVSYEMYNQHGHSRFEIKCIENTFCTEAEPFGINVVQNSDGTTDISFTLLYSNYAGGITFEWSRSNLMTTKNIDISFVSKQHKDLVRTNFDFILNTGDNIAKSFRDNSTAVYRLGQDTGSIIVSGPPTVYTKPYSIKIPRRYKALHVITSVSTNWLGNNINGKCTLYQPSVTYIDLSYANTESTFSLYVIVFSDIHKGDTDFNYVYDGRSGESIIASGSEMGLKCDGIDEYNYYFHIVNPVIPGNYNSYGDNYFSIIGLYPYKNTVMGSLARSSEKKLRSFYQNIHIKSPSILLQ